MNPTNPSPGHPPGPPTFAPLPLDAPGSQGKPLRICIASFDLVGPIRNGGVGTAFTSLAEALAAAGHEVTLLYLSGQWCENKTLGHWIEDYRRKNIRFVPLPEQTALKLVASWHQAKSYETYLYLKDQDFDIIHFSEWRGPGYYSILARRQGLAFAHTSMCVHTHGPTFWSRLSNGEYIREPEDLDLDFIERKSVELADVVVSPSQYLFRWMLDQGWALPANAFVQQYVRPATARQAMAAPPRGVLKPEELVFFGRLEVRKGLVLFCDAMDKLKNDPELRHLRLTFLGKWTDVGGVPGDRYLKGRVQGWPWSWQVLPDKDQAGAMDYLRGGPRLALMPSLADNLPNTVLECLGARVPFLTSDIGGIPEMIAPQDLEATCVPLNPSVLAEKIRNTVRQGIKPAVIAVDPEENERAWIRWHEGWVRSACTSQTPPLKNAPEDQPKVSVCLSHFNRPQFLRQALDSILAQDYPHIEVVLVDDASTDPAAQSFLDNLAPTFAKRDWQLLRNTSERFVGAARNQAARQARGQYLLFMDDDNFAKPHEVSTFIRAAQATGADITTCFLDFFSGHTSPSASTPLMHRVLFLGDAAAGGALRNTFGDTNALIRREVFLKLGGFHELRNVGHEDWQLYASAILKGYHLQVLPEALVWYRRNDAERFATRTNSLHAGHMQNIRPFLDAVPPALRNLILFVQGQSIQLEQGQGQTAHAIANSKFTIQWRSLYEAAKAVAALNHPDRAVEMFLDALKAAEASQHPLIILEALLFVGKELTGLDADRARQSLQLAAQLAKNLNNAAAYQQALGLLKPLSSPTRTAPSSNASSQAQVTATAKARGSRPSELTVEALETAPPAKPRQAAARSVPVQPVTVASTGRSELKLPKPAVSLDQVLVQVSDLLNANRNQEALGLIDSTLLAHPQGHRLQLGRAIALARLGRALEARQALLQLPVQDQAAGKVQGLLRELESLS